MTNQPPSGETNATPNTLATYRTQQPACSTTLTVSSSNARMKAWENSREYHYALQTKSEILLLAISKPIQEICHMKHSATTLVTAAATSAGISLLITFLIFNYDLLEYKGLTEYKEENSCVESSFVDENSPKWERDALSEENPYWEDDAKIMYKGLSFEGPSDTADSGPYQLNGVPTGKIIYTTRTPGQLHVLWFDTPNFFQEDHFKYLMYEHDPEIEELTGEDLNLSMSSPASVPITPRHHHSALWRFGDGPERESLIFRGSSYQGPYKSSSSGENYLECIPDGVEFYVSSTSNTQVDIIFLEEADYTETAKHISYRHDGSMRHLEPTGRIQHIIIANKNKAEWRSPRNRDEEITYNKLVFEGVIYTESDGPNHFVGIPADRAAYVAHTPSQIHVIYFEGPDYSDAESAEYIVFDHDGNYENREPVSQAREISIEPLAEHIKSSN
ncbi:MAG: hypothetical protein QM621_11765 [Aeromicrobium sp.]|uniref:hypothetical protein n=1 Tax=Aeromicrobium sp. TaxID=1871063 RepID=UPI0039E2DD28